MLNFSDYLAHWKDPNECWSYLFLETAQGLEENDFINIENKVHFFILQREDNSNSGCILTRKIPEF